MGVKSTSWTDLIEHPDYPEVINRITHTKPKLDKASTEELRKIPCGCLIHSRGTNKRSLED